MSRKNTPSVRFRQQLRDAVTNGGEGFSGYVRLAAQAMLQTAMEAEVAEFIGRSGYQRRSEEQNVYSNTYKGPHVTRRKRRNRGALLTAPCPRTA